MDRRVFLRGLSASFALTLSNVNQAWALRDTPLSKFYLDVTKKAFDNTFGGAFEKNLNENELRKLLDDKEEAYKENYLRAVQEHVLALSESDAKALRTDLLSRWNKNGGGLLGVVQQDYKEYTRGGRMPDVDSSNPLYYAIWQLKESGSINSEDFYDKTHGVLQRAVNYTHGKESFRSFHAQIMQSVDLSIKNIPVLKLNKI